MNPVATIGVGTAALNGILGAGILLLVLVVPGWLLVRRRLPAGTPALERWALAGGLGLAAVVFATAALLAIPFATLGLPDRQVLPLLPFAAVAIVSLLGWAASRRREAPPQPAPTRAEWLGLATTGVVFLLFFVGLEDDYYAPTCLYQSLVDLFDPSLRDSPLRGPSLLLSIDSTERYGNVFFVSTFLGLFQQAGIRVASAVAAGLLFLTVAALGRQTTGKTAAGLVAAAALVATGDVWQSEIVNVNMIAAWAGALFLLLLAPAHRAAHFARPLAAATLFGARYVALLGMGSLLYALWREGRGTSAWRRSLPALRMAGLFLAFTLPIHLAHTLSKGSPFQLPAFREYGPHAHEFFGLPFALRGMWNVPFTDELVRTPFNPLPMWLGWPVHTAGQWGLFGVALMGLGLWFAWWRRAHGGRDVLALWGLYFLPVALFLGVQENWLQPAKMTIGLTLAPVLAGLLALGLTALRAGGWAQRLRRGGFALGLAAILLLGGGALLRGAEFPQDPRFRQEYPELRTERPEDLAFARDRWLRWSWSPLSRAPGVLRSWGRKAHDAAAVIARPGFGPRAPSVRERMFAAFLPDAYERGMREQRVSTAAPSPAPGLGRPLHLALGESPILAEEPLRPGDPGEGFALDLTGATPCAEGPAEGLRLPFSDRPMLTLACREDDAAYVFLAPGSTPAPPREARSLSLVLPVSLQRIVLVEFICLDPSLAYLREGTIRADGTVALGEAAAWRHN